MERNKNSQGNEVWKRPSGQDDIQDTQEKQIVPLSVQGEWHFNEYGAVFVVSNDSEIQACCEHFFFSKTEKSVKYTKA